MCYLPFGFPEFRTFPISLSCELLLRGSDCKLLFWLLFGKLLFKLGELSSGLEIKLCGDNILFRLLFDDSTPTPFGLLEFGILFEMSVFVSLFKLLLLFSFGLRLRFRLVFNKLVSLGSPPRSSRLENSTSSRFVESSSLSSFIELFVFRLLLFGLFWLLFELEDVICCEWLLEFYVRKINKKN